MNLTEAFTGAGTEGVYHLSGGEVGYTYADVNDDGTFDLRYESGWYCNYNNEGVRRVAGRPDGDHRNIVKFESMTWDEARLLYPDLSSGFHP